MLFLCVFSKRLYCVELDIRRMLRIRYFNFSRPYIIHEELQHNKFTPNLALLKVFYFRMPFISSFDARRSFPTAGTGTTSNYTSSSSSSSSNPRGFDRFSSSRKSTVFERPSAYTPSSSTSSFTYSSSRPSTLER